MVKFYLPQTMTSYSGYIDTLQDGILLIESARMGQIQKVNHRLAQQEHGLVQSGSIFVWNEAEVNIRRWTDGRNWSNSRLKGRFLIYKETKAEHPMRKKTLCARTISGEKFHIICYYYESDIPILKRPSDTLSSIEVPKEYYFVGGENSPLMMFDPQLNEAVRPTVEVPFLDDIKLKSNKHPNSPHSDSAINHSRNPSTSIPEKLITSSTSTASASPLFSIHKMTKLPPLHSLEKLKGKRFRIDEDYIKLLQSAIF
eukprot:NODE_7_length_67686_cov_1.621421.p28 type:complete len:256 gc:universal NODE_7_length_67686_cov_1.621421:24057-23290(-)